LEELRFGAIPIGKIYKHSKIDQGKWNKWIIEAWAICLHMKEWLILTGLNEVGLEE
jgi:hypothetical protein